MRSYLYKVHQYARTLMRNVFMNSNAIGVNQRPVIYRERGYASKSTSEIKTSKHVPKIDMSTFPQENIRNFSIVAHVDHGKSTLSDRLLELTGTIPSNSKNEQVLDTLPVEKERGITVKAQAASMFYECNEQTYLLNLIDTPGHVDFSYEVSRSIGVCQGVTLLVDASQGVQAQTVSNFNMALLGDLTIIPVINKIDLKTADLMSTATQIESLFGIKEADILKVSAKLGTGVQELLQAIIKRIPPPKGDPNKPFRAIMFDSWYDRHRGLLPLVAVVDGKITAGDNIASHLTGKSYTVKDVGILHPNEKPVDELYAGQVGYISANIRELSDVKVGDTFYQDGEIVEPLSKIEPAKPMVYAGIYAVDQSQNVEMRSSIEKLTLSDPSVSVSMETSPALGQGWRLGFLGLLHMEVFCQRLDQEFDAQVVITAPSVPYKVKIKGQKNIKNYGSEEIIVTDPLKMPDPHIISEYFEPMVLGTVIMPNEYMGKIVRLCIEKRGIQKNLQSIDEKNVMLQFVFPLNEVIVDFFDELKAASSGYASFDYEDAGYQKSDLVIVSFLLNGQQVEELTMISHVSKARHTGRHVCLRLKETIPPQQFVISIQAAIGGKIIARENIKAVRKDVAAKLYGGDITRRMKLLQRQTEGKKRMRMIGNVEVPRDTFIKIVKR